MFDHLIEKLTGTVVQEAEKTRLTLESGFRSSLRGTRLTGALPRRIDSAPVAYVAAGRLVGWSLYASGGPVRLLLHDGHDTTGDVIAVVDLVAGENETVWLGPGGVSFVEALYVEQIGTGTPLGSLWIGAVD